MTGIAMHRRSNSRCKTVSICVTLKNDPIVRNHGKSIAKNIAKTAQSRSSSRFFPIFSMYLNCLRMTESPDFLRNQDFFRIFASNNLLPIFSDPNADPNGSG